jgi:hypothetical protein
LEHATLATSDFPSMFVFGHLVPMNGQNGLVEQCFVWM